MPQATCRVPQAPMLVASEASSKTHRHIRGLPMKPRMWQICGLFLKEGRELHGSEPWVGDAPARMASDD